MNSSRDDNQSSDRANFMDNKELNFKSKSPFGFDIIEDYENECIEGKDSQYIPFNSFYVSEHADAAQDLKMPDYGSMKEKTAGEDFNQSESYIT